MMNAEMSLSMIAVTRSHLDQAEAHLRASLTPDSPHARRPTGETPTFAPGSLTRLRLENGAEVLLAAETAPPSLADGPGLAPVVLRVVHEAGPLAAAPLSVLAAAPQPAAGTEATQAADLAARNAHHAAGIAQVNAAFEQLRAIVTE